MIEITQTRAEDAIDHANTFLEHERNAELDGGYAAQSIQERIYTKTELAEALLCERPVQGAHGLYAPLSKQNVHDFAHIAATLPGYMVLIPAVTAGNKINELYPAVVSEQDATAQSMRLHVLKKPYRQSLMSSAGVILSASGQSETKGVGKHGHSAGDGVEAEHFATIIAAGSDRQVQDAWQRGAHVNHQWRERTDSSVTAQMSQRLFGSEIPQATITITKQQVASGQAGLLWHEGMRNQETGLAEAATRDSALVVIQALGLEALKATSPQGIDNVKRLISS